MGGLHLYIQRFRNGYPSFFPKEIVEKIISREASKGEYEEIFNYSEGGAEVYLKECRYIDGFYILYPHGKTIFERVVEIAKVTQSLIYWPETEIYMAVTDISIIRHLPEELRLDRDHIAIVRNVEELLAAIYS